MQFNDIFRIKRTLDASMVDFKVELGFKPTEIIIDNITAKTQARLVEDFSKCQLTDANGSVTESSTAIAFYDGAEKVVYDNAQTPTYKIGSSSVDPDSIIGVNNESVLAIVLPKLVNSTDDGNSYMTKPGFSIDVSEVGSNGDVLVITASR